MMRCVRSMALMVLLLSMVGALFAQDEQPAETITTPRFTLRQRSFIHGMHWAEDSSGFWYYGPPEGGSYSETQIRFWDAQDGTLLHGIRYEGYGEEGKYAKIGVANWQAGNNRILLTGGQEIIVWDGLTGETVFSDGPVNTAYYGVWTQDKSHIVYALPDGVTVANIETGEIKTYPLQPQDGTWLAAYDVNHGSEIWLAVNVKYTSKLRIYDVVTGRVVTEGEIKGEPVPIYSAEWSDNGAYLLLRTSEAIKVMDAGTGALYPDTAIQAFNGVPGPGSHEGYFGPDRHTALIYWTAQPTINVWDLNTNTLVNTLDHQFVDFGRTYQDYPDFVYDAQWNMDGTRIMSHTGYTLRLWTGTGSLIFSIFSDTGILRAYWNADESRIGYMDLDGALHIIDAASGDEQFIIPPLERPEQPSDNSNRYGFAWSPDGTQIMMWGILNRVWVYDSATGGLLAEYRLSDDTTVDSKNTYALWSPDGSMILTRIWPCNDLYECAEVQVWDAP